MTFGNCDAMTAGTVDHEAANLGERSLRMGAYPPRFHDPEIERAYRAKWLEATRRDHLMWSAAATVVYVALSAKLWLSAEPGFIEFQWFRLFVCIPLLIGALFFVWQGDFNEEQYFPRVLPSRAGFHGGNVTGS